MTSPGPVLHRFHFEELDIKPEPLLELMGYAGNQAPDPIPDLLHHILEEAPRHAAIRGGFVRPEKFEFAGKGILVDNIDFQTGNLISDHLEHAEQLAFFLLTAGPGMEAWSRQMMESGDPVAGYMIDLLASEVVETSMDLMQASLEQSLLESGLKTTNRYSPGYCGWPVKDQQQLFRLFPTSFCGIRLSESSLMIPIKSVSGVIGIGSQVEKKGYICQYCEMKDCLYRIRKTAAET